MFTSLFVCLVIAQQVVRLGPLVRASREALDELARIEPVREEITVSATRTDRRLEDEPVRVEVLDPTRSKRRCS